MRRHRLLVRSPLKHASMRSWLIERIRGEIVKSPLGSGVVSFIGGYAYHSWKNRNNNESLRKQDSFWRVRISRGTHFDKPSTCAPRDTHNGSNLAATFTPIKTYQEMR
jgi:hypothetical protein